MGRGSYQSTLRVRRLVRPANLPAPNHTSTPRGPDTDDGTGIPDAPDRIRGTDLARIVAAQYGRVTGASRSTARRRRSSAGATRSARHDTRRPNPCSRASVEGLGGSPRHRHRWLGAGPARARRATHPSRSKRSRSAAPVQRPAIVRKSWAAVRYATSGPRFCRHPWRLADAKRALPAQRFRCSLLQHARP